MRDILPQETLHERLPERIRGPCGCNADEQRAQVANDEASNKQIHKVEYQMINRCCKVRTLLSLGKAIERACGGSKDQCHQWQGSANDDTT